MNAPLKKRSRGRPKLNETGQHVAPEFAIADRDLCARTRPGRIIGARVVYNAGACRLVVMLSWKRGEFTVTANGGNEVREWRSIDQALKRLWTAYGFEGTAIFQKGPAPGW